jgi:hypothetical protein
METIYLLSAGLESALAFGMVKKNYEENELRNRNESSERVSCVVLWGFWAREREDKKG